MARPNKNNVDYFPHGVKHGKKMSYIEKKYKNDGYATWFKILEELGDADNHYLNLSDEIELMFLSNRCNVSEEVLLNIVSDLSRLGEFDKELWEHKIIWGTRFIKTIKDAYIKRTNKCIDLHGLRILLDSLGVRKLSKSKSEGVRNTQSKVKESKEDESKENKSKLNNTLLSKIEISDLEIGLQKYFEISKVFQKLFIKNLTEKNAPTSNQEKAKFKNYVDPIRLMIETDKVTLEQLQIVFKYLDSLEGEFWKSNILSTKKLREKFPQLVIKAQENANRTNSNKTGNKSSVQGTFDAIDTMFGE
tara:strand:+ start:4501 stop:5412 length:912 start_codon:yes stop_codon:yes gene_type:complete